MNQSAFIGIDVGTSSIKVIAVSPEGDLLASSSSPMAVEVQRPGWSEQTPEDWWRGTCSAIRSVLIECDNAEILGVALSGQMHSLVALDDSDRVIRPAILWNDVRSSAEAEYVRSVVGEQTLRRTVGNPSLEGFTVTKLLWLKNHEPDHYRRISRILLAKDYVRYRLTGEMGIEPSDASGTLLFDVFKNEWSEEICDLLGVDKRVLPRIVGSDEAVGHITSSAANETGLTKGVPVVGGGADNACAATGAGAVSEGDVLFTIGTSGAVVAPISRPVADPGMRIHSMRHAIPDTWYLMGVVLSAGAALDWWRRSSGTVQFDELVAEAAAVEPGAGGVTFLPYLTGERTPHADANARGVFFGMHGGTGRAHMTRAVMEGVSFAMRDSLELMNDLQVAPEDAIAVGGGATSPTWLQMLSDVVALPLRTVGPAEGAPLGAAMLASVGTGHFSSAKSAGDAWLHNESSVEPDQRNRQAYDDAYSRYTDLYPALRQLFASSADR